MREDLSGPYPGFGLGALDAFHGLVVYRLLDPVGLAPEIADMEALVEASYRALTITQDLGLGMMLWMSHFFPDEPWAVLQRTRALAMLDRMWVDPPGYFCREPTHRQVKFAFTNYGVSLGLQAVPAHGDRVRRLNAFFDFLPLRRRVRHQCHHARHGVHVPFPGTISSPCPSLSGSPRSAAADGQDRTGRAGHDLLGDTPQQKAVHARPTVAADHDDIRVPSARGLHDLHRRPALHELRLDADASRAGPGQHGRQAAVSVVSRGREQIEIARRRAPSTSDEWRGRREDMQDQQPRSVALRPLARDGQGRT